MMHIIKNSLLSNKTIKIMSVIIGYSFWAILGQHHTIDQWVEVPLCFYNGSEKEIVSAPEKVCIQIQAKRSDFKALQYKDLALHIDIDHLSTGKQLLSVTAQKLFLPNSFKLVNCKPSNLIVEVQKNSKQSEL